VANKEIFKQSASNTAVVIKGSSWVGQLRVRMSDQDQQAYGPCNTLSISNSSNQEAQLRFGLNVENGRPLYSLKPNSIKNILVDDGIAFYGFDLMNLDTVTDIAIGSITYTMARVVDTLNPSISDSQYTGARRLY
jgi:hypothetical protein